MNRERVQVKPVHKSAPFQPLHIADLFRFHLPMQYLHPVQPDARRLIDHMLNGRFFWGKVPVRVCRHAKFHGVVLSRIS